VIVLRSSTPCLERKASPLTGAAMVLLKLSRREVDPDLPDTIFDSSCRCTLLSADVLPATHYPLYPVSGLTLAWAIPGDNVWHRTLLCTPSARMRAKRQSHRTYALPNSLRKPWQYPLRTKLKGGTARQTRWGAVGLALFSWPQRLWGTVPLPTPSSPWEQSSGASHCGPPPHPPPARLWHAG